MFRPMAGPNGRLMHMNTTTKGNNAMTQANQLIRQLSKFTQRYTEAVNDLLASKPKPPREHIDALINTLVVCTEQFEDLIRDLEGNSRRGKAKKQNEQTQEPEDLFPLYRPIYAKLDPQALAALRNIIFMALPDWPRSPALPLDIKPSTEINGGLEST